MGTRRTRTRWAAALVAGSVAALTPLAPAGAQVTPPPEPPPDYTINTGLGDISLCGEHDFGTLTIDGGRTLSVATFPDPSLVPVRAGEPPRPRCAAGDEGVLTINANRIVNNGTIDGSSTQFAPMQPPQPGNPPAGMGGGGHGGEGGDGPVGSGGDAYGDLDMTAGALTTEAGAPGAGIFGGGGRGGGALVLRAVPQAVLIDGELVQQFGNIDSTGTIRAGGDPGFGFCGGLLQPGAGGGGGGGIVLDAHRLNLSGPITANGGRGGIGYPGAGGGGGGVIKVRAPIVVTTGGFATQVNGGDAGIDCQSTSDGVPGAPGIVLVDTTPVGSAHDPVAFWNDATVSVPVSAAASVGGASPSGFTVFLCGLRSTVPATTGDFAVPASNTAVEPCGPGASALASKSFSVFEVQPTDPNGFVNLNLPGASNEGYWGVWATVVRGGEVSGPPAQVQTVFGVDNSPPTVTPNVAPVPASGWYTGDVAVSWTVGDTLSPVTQTTGCDPVTITSDGTSSLTCVATSTGGTISSPLEVRRDATRPEITGKIDPANPSASGWYVVAPTVSFECEDAPSGVASCSGPTTLSSSASPQSVQGTAVDFAGNTNTAAVSNVLVDLEDPALTCGATPQFSVGGAGSVSATVTDAHSGPAASTASAAADTSAAGTFTATVTGADVAGNMESVGCPYVVNKVPTKLTTHKAIVIRPPLSISVHLTLGATLRRGDTGAPIAGEPVTFSVGGRYVCTATTNAEGVAMCGGLMSVVTALLAGRYEATYPGDGGLLGSSATGSLL